jgi:diaminopropionate ammonia-lyase
MPSFKILGASWATHRALCARLGIPHEEVPSADALARRLQGSALTLVAATDGNHGRAVARMARLLGLRAHILVPDDMVAARIDGLRSEDARVTVIDGGYDAAVAASARLEDDDHVVVSDTSWPGYETIPGWVIDGYSTLTAEVEVQRRAQGLAPFSATAVQIGVGAFAAAIARAFRHDPTRVVGVEPVAADCVTSSIEAGHPVALPGQQTSIMAGLNCGTPSPVAWPDLRHGIDQFVTVEDAEAELAMRVLAEDGIVSGESGAAGLAGLIGFRQQLGLGKQDHVLVVSTEGATDPAGYARAVRGEALPASSER